MATAPYTVDASDPSRPTEDLSLGAAAAELRAIKAALLEARADTADLEERALVHSGSAAYELDADIDANNYKITRLGAATDTFDALALGQATTLINALVQDRLGALNQISWVPGISVVATPTRQWTIQGNIGYIATANHTASASFAADLAAGLWLQLDVLQLYADLMNAAVNKGAALVYADDGEGGAKFSTVAGFIANQVASGSLGGLRNLIINGDMRISQRGVSFPAASSYTLDRWAIVNTTGGAVTISQENDIFIGNRHIHYLKAAVTTADAAIAATDTYALYQKITAYNIMPLWGRTFTLSFWVRTTKVGTYCVALKNSSADRAYVAEYTVTAANVWEQKVITVTGGIPTAVGGSWGVLNGPGLTACFTLANGTTRQVAAGSWVSGDYYSSPAQVNALDTVGARFELTGVQLEVGQVANDFEHRPVELEAVLCERYYMLIGDWAMSGYSDGNTAFFHCPTRVQMRASPTYTETGAADTVNVSLFQTTPLSTGVQARVAPGSAGFLRTRRLGAALNAEL